MEIGCHASRSCLVEDENESGAADVDAGEEEDDENAAGDAGNRRGPGFVQSKWDTVDPELVQQQAMTTSSWSKWETLEETAAGEERMETNDETAEEADVDGKSAD